MLRIDAPPRLLATTERFARLRTSAVLSAMLAAGALVDPSRPLPFDVCLLKRLTGLSCPTCGLTRSVCHLLQGDLTGSLALHPAGIPVVVGLAGWIALSGFEAIRGRRLRDLFRA